MCPFNLWIGPCCYSQWFHQGQVCVKSTSTTSSVSQPLLIIAMLLEWSCCLSHQLSDFLSSLINVLSLHAASCTFYETSQRVENSHVVVQMICISLSQLLFHIMSSSNPLITCFQDWCSVSMWCSFSTCFFFNNLVPNLVPVAPNSDQPQFPTLWRVMFYCRSLNTHKSAFPQLGLLQHDNI